MEIEEGYLKSHFLRGNLLCRGFLKHEIDQFNNKIIMDKINSTLTVGTKVLPNETQFVHTKVTTEAPIVNNPIELSVAMSPQGQWYKMDGEKTNFLSNSEEFFLASQENEGARTRLVQHITEIDQSNPCKLITLSSPNNISGSGMPRETTEIKFAHDDLDITDQLLLGKRLHKSVANLHDNETTVEVHETSNNERPMPNSTYLQKSSMLAHHVANSHIENTRSSIITKNIVTVKVKSQVELDDNQIEDCSSTEPKVVISTRKRLLEPTIVVHDNPRILVPHSSSTRDQPSLCSEWHDTEQERENRDSVAGIRASSHAKPVAENFEDRGRNGAFAMTNQNNRSNVAQRPQPRPRKVAIPKKILKSVYERCDLDSVRPPGYTVLCNVQFPKGSPLKHHEDHIHTNIKVSPPSQLENADAIDPQSTFREEVNICHDDASGNKENIGKGNEHLDFGSQGSEEELNILASLERLDYKLATINGKFMNSERNSLNSCQLSSKSTQSAPPILVQRGRASSSLEKMTLVSGKSKNFHCNPPRPLSAKSPFQKPPRGSRQRQVIGITNKCKVKPNELYFESPINYPPVVFPDVKPQKPTTSSLCGP